MLHDSIIFFFVILMIAIPCVTALLLSRNSYLHKERKLEIQARIEEAKAAQAAAPNEVQAHLEDRLRVLERIVTDPSTNLAREIEDLRELKIEREKVQ